MNPRYRAIFAANLVVGRLSHYLAQWQFHNPIGTEFPSADLRSTAKWPIVKRHQRELGARGAFEKWHWVELGFGQ